MFIFSGPPKVQCLGQLKPAPPPPPLKHPAPTQHTLTSYLTGTICLPTGPQPVPPLPGNHKAAGQREGGGEACRAEGGGGICNSSTASPPGSRCRLPCETRSCAPLLQQADIFCVCVCVCGTQRRFVSYPLLRRSRNRLCWWVSTLYFLNTLGYSV